MRTQRSARQLTGATALLLAACTVSMIGQAGAPMNTQTMSLWQIIERLAQQMPFNKEAFEEALGAPLTLHKQDKFKSQWVSGQVRLRDNIQISDASLVLGPTGEFKPSSGATLNLTGACVTRDQIKVQFDDLTLVSHPRGRSLQEVTAFGTDQPWGKLIFAFRENNPECLAYVTLRAPDQE